MNGDKNILQHLLLRFSLINLFIVAGYGLLIRGIPYLEYFPFDYKNILHGHSHFAFGGWVTPVLTWLIMQYFPSLKEKVSYRHWRNIIIIFLISAYGMLVIFPFQGYSPLSIFFSTLSVAGTYYLAIVLSKAARSDDSDSSRFLKASLFFLVLSSFGAFATGPLAAIGEKGSSWYYNAVYFYLHFQYNGWFTFAILAVLYKIMDHRVTTVSTRYAFKLFSYGCLLTFFLSVLWNKPPLIFYIIGSAGALLQVAGLYFFLSDAMFIKANNSFIRRLQAISLTAFVIKNILQLASGFPFVADLAFKNRNFIIAYLHLVMLGFVTLYVLVSILKTEGEPFTSRLRVPVISFLAAFLLTEILMLVQAFVSIPYIGLSLFYFSILFPVSTGLICFLTGRPFRLLKDHSPLHSLK